LPVFASYYSQIELAEVYISESIILKLMHVSLNVFW